MLFRWPPLCKLVPSVIVKLGVLFTEILLHAVTVHLDLDSFVWIAGVPA